MCDECNNRIEEVGRAAGIPIVTVLHEPERNVLVYAAFLGKATLSVELPIGADLRHSADLAAYIGMHLTEVISSATEAFLESTVEGQAALTIHSLEQLLEEQ